MYVSIYETLIYISKKKKNLLPKVSWIYSNITTSALFSQFAYHMITIFPPFIFLYSFYCLFVLGNLYGQCGA